MICWEYITESFDVAKEPSYDVTGKFDRLGERGWELVTLYRDAHGDMQAIFKRQFYDRSNDE